MRERLYVFLIKIATKISSLWALECWIRNNKIYKKYLRIFVHIIKIPLKRGNTISYIVDFHWYRYRGYTYLFHSLWLLRAYRQLGVHFRAFLRFLLFLLYLFANFLTRVYDWVFLRILLQDLLYRQCFKRML